LYHSFFISSCFFFFFVNDPATTLFYTLSLHDALPIFLHFLMNHKFPKWSAIIIIFALMGLLIWLFYILIAPIVTQQVNSLIDNRSEEHTSELQSRFDLVCRLLLEKKK